MAMLYNVSVEYLGTLKCNILHDMNCIESDAIADVTHRFKAGWAKMETDQWGFFEINGCP